MTRTKLIVIGALMAALAAVFQSLPVLFSEVFVIFTIISALPIYIACRVNPFSGILSFFVAVALIFLISTHEGLFFLCSNGVVGLSLGLCRYYKLNKLIIIIISPFAMTTSLSLMNYGIGIPIFGADLPGSLLFQVLAIFMFSFVYNAIFLFISDIMYKRIKITGIHD